MEVGTPEELTNALDPKYKDSNDYAIIYIYIKSSDIYQVFLIYRFSPDLIPLDITLKKWTFSPIENTRRIRKIIDRVNINLYGVGHAEKLTEIYKQNQPVTLPYTDEKTFEESQVTYPAFQYNLARMIDDMLIGHSKNLDKSYILTTNDGELLVFAQNPNISAADRELGRGRYRIIIEPLDEFKETED